MVTVPAPLNISGEKYGRLTVIERASNIGRNTAWWCECECGNRVVAKTAHLRNRGKQSCGCLRREVATKLHTTHGQTGSRLYTIWRLMRQRCSDRNNPGWDYYGGRGIRVCDEWQEFEPFMRWALANGYADDLEIDRIDNDGDYTAGNCRWATRYDQANNTRRNRLVELNGEVQTVSEWAESLGIDYRTLLSRINRGWSVRRAFTEPIARR